MPIDNGDRVEVLRGAEWKLGTVTGFGDECGVNVIDVKLDDGIVVFVRSPRNIRKIMPGLSDVTRLRDLALWHTLSASTCRERASRRKPWNRGPGRADEADELEALQHESFARFLTSVSDDLAIQGRYALPLPTTMPSPARELESAVRADNLARSKLEG